MLWITRLSIALLFFEIYASEVQAFLDNFVKETGYCFSKPSQNVKNKLKQCACDVVRDQKSSFEDAGEKMLKTNDRNEKCTLPSLKPSITDIPSIGKVWQCIEVKFCFWKGLDLIKDSAMDLDRYKTVMANEFEQSTAETKESVFKGIDECIEKSSDQNERLQLDTMLEMFLPSVIVQILNKLAAPILHSLDDVLEKMSSEISNKGAKDTICMTNVLMKNCKEFAYLASINVDALLNKLPGGTKSNAQGSGSTDTGGNGSTNTEGNGATDTGGNGSTDTGGNGSTDTGGSEAPDTGGSGATDTGGNGSTDTGGNGSTDMGGNGSTDTGGNGTTDTGGNGTTNTGGHESTDTGGSGATVGGGLSVPGAGTIGGGGLTVKGTGTISGGGMGTIA